MNCTGNCNQGRACDCTPDIDEPELEPLTPMESIALVMIYLCSSLLSLGLIGFLIFSAFAWWGFSHG